MNYIEENMRKRRGEVEEDEEEKPYDPHEELFRIDTTVPPSRKKGEEGSVGNSLAMLTAIPEVDLGME